MSRCLVFLQHLLCDEIMYIYGCAESLSSLFWFTLIYFELTLSKLALKLPALLPKRAALFGQLDTKLFKIRRLLADRTRGGAYFVEANCRRRPIERTIPDRTGDAGM